MYVVTTVIGWITQILEYVEISCNGAKMYLVILFERSEFLIVTSKKRNLRSTNLGLSREKKMCVCSTNLGFSGGSANRYCCRTLRQYDTRYVQYRATSKKKKTERPAPAQGATHTHSATHAQQRACDNCGQRNRGCSCCLMDRVAHD